MSGAIPPLPQYAFMAQDLQVWRSFKNFYVHFGHSKRPQDGENGGEEREMKST
jgi:hypothetical protein